MNNEVSFWQELIKTLATFFLGMASSWMAFYVKHYFQLKAKQKFTIDYLRNNILPQIKLIKTSYKNAEEAIISDSDFKYTAFVFEEFSIYPLSSIHPYEFHQIFKKNEFILFHEIYSMIEFLQKHLPNTIINDYFEKVNLHLQAVDMTGNINHIKECSRCNQLKGKCIKAVKGKINEFDLLEDKILRLINEA